MHVHNVIMYISIIVPNNAPNDGDETIHPVLNGASINDNDDESLLIIVLVAK